MFPVRNAYLSFILTLLLIPLVSCRGDSAAEPSAAPPDPALEPPALVRSEEPLQGDIPDVPNVLVVASRQPKAALATFLKTTPAQLDWVNPGLPDPVPPDTLVVIPPVYRTEGETLSEVAENTGLSEELLRAANPGLEEDVLAEGTVLVVPPLYIPSADTLLSATADMLSVSAEDLLSANPELLTQEEIRAGTVLVVPLQNEGAK